MRSRDGDKQKRIKEAVMRLILENGFEGTSVSRIAEEAGVSPATIYVYYESKEDMLREIYLEYSADMFGFLADGIDEGMGGGDLIDSLMRNFYRYAQEKSEIFGFVEQFSGCPCLAGTCRGNAGMERIFEAIDRKKSEGVFVDASDFSIVSVIFRPVKEIAWVQGMSGAEKERILEDEIMLIERALLL